MITHDEEFVAALGREHAEHYFRITKDPQYPPPPPQAAQSFTHQLRGYSQIRRLEMGLL